MVAISEAAQASAVYFGHFIQVCASLTPRNIVQLDLKQQQHPLSNENQQAMKYIYVLYIYICVITHFHLHIFVIKKMSLNFGDKTHLIGFCR